MQTFLDAMPMTKEKIIAAYRRGRVLAQLQVIMS